MSDAAQAPWVTTPVVRRHLGGMHHRTLRKLMARTPAWVVKPWVDQGAPGGRSRFLWELAEVDRWFRRSRG